MNRAPTMNRTPIPPDTIDVVEVVRNLVRGWPVVILGILLGGMAAGVVNLWGPIQYEATASVVLRDRTEGGGSQLALGAGAMEGLSDLFSLPGQMGSLVDTEVEILQSRELLNQVSDAAWLQLQVRSPRGVPADSVFSRVQIDPGIRKAEYTLRNEGGEIRVEGEGVSVSAPLGGTLELPGATLALRPDGVPDRIRFRLLDRQDVVDRILKKEVLSAEVLGGDLAEVRFTAWDGATAARAANAAVELYLRERRDRMGMVTGNRIRILSQLGDSLQGELNRATSDYRSYQEQERAFDPERLGDLERAAELRAQVDQLGVEASALDEVLARVEDEAGLATDILAYPSFLQSDAINNVLDRIFTLQTERFELLKRRTERDPDVILLEQTTDYLKAELISLARSYRDGIQRQLDGLQGELARYRTELASRPSLEERAFELENEIERLTASYLGVQRQLVQLRLEGIGEGIDLRQIDVAPPPKKPVFPVWWLNLGIGLFLGLILGLVGALVRGALHPLVRGASDLRRISGLPVISAGQGALPLIVHEVQGYSAVMVLPLAGAAEGFARLAETQESVGAPESLGAPPQVLAGLGDRTLAQGLREDACVVPVVQGGLTPRKVVEEALEALEVVGAPVPGILLLPE